MTTPTALKACPFCGGNHVQTHPVRDGRVAKCRGCDASGGPEYFGPDTMSSAEDRAIAAWNRRTPEPGMVVPQNVLDALARMEQPLHESLLSGATAKADADCMKVIGDFIRLIAAAQEHKT